MKVRSGFVSNSSSSSFICDVTGSTASGWDMGLEDAGMYECENEHTFIESLLVGDKSEFEKELENEYGEDWYYESRYEIPAKYCPICSFETLTDSDYLYFVLLMAYTNREKVLEEIKSKFDTYQEFKEYITKE